MGEFAQFVALKETTDDAFRLPDSTGNKRTFKFDLPDLDPTRTVIVMFKVAMSGDIRLRMRINENVELSIDFTLDPPPGLHQPRSWHEIMGPREGFKAASNVLSVLGESSQPAAAVTVSDIVFLYHAKT